MNSEVLTDQKVKMKENEKINIYSDLAKELKRIIEHEDGGDTNCSWCTWNGPQRLVKETVGIGNKKKNQDHPDHSVVKIYKNIQKCPGNLKRFAATLEEDHQFKPVGKTHKEGNKINYIKAKLDNTQ